MFLMSRLKTSKSNPFHDQIILQVDRTDSIDELVSHQQHPMSELIGWKSDQSALEFYLVNKKAKCTKEISPALKRINETVRSKAVGRLTARLINLSVDPLLGASLVASPPAYIAIAKKPTTLNTKPISVIIFGARLEGNFDATDLQKG